MSTSVKDRGQWTRGSIARDRAREEAKFSAPLSAAEQTYREALSAYRAASDAWIAACEVAHAAGVEVDAQRTIDRDAAKKALGAAEREWIAVGQR